MRALCGAIITAGALIGLGLASLGVGVRYQMERALTEKGEPTIMRLRDMDTPLVFSLVFLTTAAITGLGIAFFGLAYHHMRREREFQWDRERTAAQQRTTI